MKNIFRTMFARWRVLLMMVLMTTLPVEADNRAPVSKFARVIEKSGKVYDMHAGESGIRLSVKESKASIQELKVSRFISRQGVGKMPIRFNIFNDRLFCTTSSIGIDTAMPFVHVVLIEDIKEANRVSNKKSFREARVDSKGIMHLPTVFLKPVSMTTSIARLEGRPDPDFDVLPRREDKLELYVMVGNEIKLWEAEISAWTEEAVRMVEWTESLTFPVEASGPFHAIAQGTNTYLVFESGPVFAVENGVLRRLGSLPAPSGGSPVLVVDGDNETVAVVSGNASEAELGAQRDVVRNARIQRTALPERLSEAVARKGRSTERESGKTN